MKLSDDVDLEQVSVFCSTFSGESCFPYSHGNLGLVYEIY